MCQSSTDWWLPEGEGEMCEGGQIDGADWKWDFSWGIQTIVYTVTEL